jgi:hypothetical protein
MKRPIVTGFSARLLLNLLLFSWELTLPNGFVLKYSLFKRWEPHAARMYVNPLVSFLPLCQQKAFISLMLYLEAAEPRGGFLYNRWSTSTKGLLVASTKDKAAVRIELGRVASMHE